MLGVPSINKEFSHINIIAKLNINPKPKKKAELVVSYQDDVQQPGQQNNNDFISGEIIHIDEVSRKKIKRETRRASLVKSLEESVARGDLLSKKILEKLND